MHIVLAYDIPDDKRRTRMRKMLLSFGTPVQYSVFEFDVSQRHLERLKRAVRGIMKRPEDNVRYYVLCRCCAKGVEVFGGNPLTEARGCYVV